MLIDKVRLEINASYQKATSPCVNNLQLADLRGKKRNNNKLKNGVNLFAFVEASAGFILVLVTTLCRISDGRFTLPLTLSRLCFAKVLYTSWLVQRMAWTRYKTHLFDRTSRHKSPGRRKPDFSLSLSCFILSSYSIRLLSSLTRSRSSSQRRRHVVFVVVVVIAKFTPGTVLKRREHLSARMNEARAAWMERDIPR